MKLLQASSAALVGMALCSVVYAYQRTADFGFSDDAETNVKAEFYWSRLSYNAAVRQQLRRRVMGATADTAGAVPGPATTPRPTARFCCR